MIKIAKNLELPVDAVTQTFAILAKRGVGKSFTADVLAEELLSAGQQVVILDPTGAHWGLRSSADGKSAGFPIVVIGGDHADVPLDEHAGETIAEAITQNHFPAIIDLSLLRKGQTIRFATAFLETLYRRNRDSLHLIVDEADTFAPQRLLGEEARMCGAMEDVVKKGRIRGLGCTLITQRPAVLNKNVLTQCESLFAMRLTHPKDIAAIREWVAVHATPEEEREVVNDLPTLPVGTGWFWSPGWMQTLVKAAIRPKRTFDSGATPKPGQKRIAPKALAAIDIDALGEKIKASAEQAKANDPVTLKRRISELEKQQKPMPLKVVTIDKGVIDRAVSVAVAERDRHWKAEVSKLMKAIAGRDDRLGKIERLAHLNGDATVAVNEPKKSISSLTPKPTIPPENRKVEHRPKKSVNRTIDTGDLPKGERIILTACAQYPDGADRTQLSILTGYKRSSRDAYLQRLREKGFVETSGDTVLATQPGVDALGDFEPLPTGDELREYWMARLPEGERKILGVLIESYPRAVPREDLIEATGYQRSSRDAYIQRLSARKLVESVGRGEVRASEELF